MKGKWVKKDSSDVVEWRTVRLELTNSTQIEIKNEVAFSPNDC